MSVKVYFLLPYPERKAPSQRFRIEAYYTVLNKRGIQYKGGFFWSKKGSLTLYQKGKTWLKLFYLCQGFLSRGWQILANIKKADYVVIHREAAPIGPPIFEWMIAKVFQKKIIYDYDDAIWIPNISAHNTLASSIKAFWKIKYICKWSYKVSVGNHYLGNWASHYNTHVVYNPTCVDMQTHYSVVKNQDSAKVTIGWTGSHSTVKYLDMVKPVLEEMEKEYDFEFIVICNQQPDWTIKSLRFIAWNETSEINDLLKINIGIMPLPQDAWSEGKCGFKLIQYLALGIPAVASPVGVNKQIIDPGENGYLCETDSEWKTALVQLIRNVSLRKKMGQAGREKMLEEFSTQSNEDNFISLFS